MSSDITGATGLPGRYAAALFELAKEKKQLDEVANDLISLDNMIKGSADFQRMIRSPIISRQNQLTAIDSILETARASQLIRNFIGVVTKNRRLFVLPNIIKGYQALLAAHRGEATAELITAKPLTDTQTSSIENSIKQTMGSKVALKSKVDPSLLGGLVLKIGSRMIDTSLKTKLSQLRLTMKGVG